MDALLEQINSVGKVFVGFALPMLAQSSVLIVILLLAELLLRKQVRAVFRYLLGMLILLQLILPPSQLSRVSLGNLLAGKLDYVSEGWAGTGAGTAGVLQPSATVAMTWQGGVFLAWLAVVVVMSLSLLQRAMFARRLVRQAREANGLMNDLLEYCRRCMGVKRKVWLKISAAETSPVVCGLFRPVILVPYNLTPSLGSRHLRAILLHELAHIKRGDLYVNLAQTILQVVYFYNPLVWLTNSMIRSVREQAVDEKVLVAMGEKARLYPQRLVDIARLAFRPPALSLGPIGVVESERVLAKRITPILNPPVPKRVKCRL